MIILPSVSEEMMRMIGDKLERKVDAEVDNPSQRLRSIPWCVHATARSFMVLISFLMITNKFIITLATLVKYIKTLSHSNSCDAGGCADCAKFCFSGSRET